MELELPLFINYLKETKNASASTVSLYQRDLRKLESYLASMVGACRECDLDQLKFIYLYLEKAGAFNGYCFTQCGFDEGFFFIMPVNRICGWMIRRNR